MVGVSDQSAERMQHAGVVASFGKGLTDLGVNSDEPTRLMQRIPQ
jgi:hypothetical protein